MSVQYGEWNFDGMPSDPIGIERASGILAPYGPDGEGRHVSGGLSVLYRSYHTTRESRLEEQPYISRSGVVVVWDGRIDNRGELISELGGSALADSSDAAVLAGSYERWGTGCFARVIGDWAVAIFDSRKRYLLFAVDPLGIRHLYYLGDANHVVWSSILDPLVLFARHPFALDGDYLAGWLASYPACDQTPYAGISAVSPACFVRWKDGHCEIARYWDFDSRKRVRYRTDGEYEEHFRSVFTQSVQRRLRTDSSILAELSGGMDSSSIVCVADKVIESGEETVRELDTVSYFDDLEPDWNERPFVAVVERHRGRAGHHIDAPQCLYVVRGSNKARFDATPSSVGASPEATRRFADCLSSGSYRVVLSGIGGDEVTGGIPNPLPELADVLVRAKFIQLIRLLVTWALNKRKPWPHLLSEVIRSFLHQSLSGSTTQSRSVAWLTPAFAQKHRSTLNPKQRLRLFGPLPSFQDSLRTLEVLRRQTACCAAVAEPLYEIRYPYLDRDLLEFLFSIPPNQLLRPGQRRSLTRRALRGIVPDEILDRRRKAAVARSPIVAISQASDDLFVVNKELASELFGLVDSAPFRDAIERIQVDETVPLIPLIRTIGMEVWLRQITASGLVDKCNSDPGSCKRKARLLAREEFSWPGHIPN